MGSTVFSVGRTLRLTVEELSVVPVARLLPAWQEVHAGRVFVETVTLSSQMADKARCFSAAHILFIC